jgi:hypothetical protein
MSCSGTIFGPGAKYIKVGNGEFIAVDGATVVERLPVGVRMPYEQVIKGKITLAAGKVGYLLNFMGLGDSATFLAMTATYNPKSTNEEDNYITWSFYDDLTKQYPMAQMMCLTGNSTNRIKQLYLNNPNTKYPVILDVMIAVIDDTNTYFNDFVNQGGTSFTGLEYTDIQSHVVGESIVIYDKNDPKRPLIYITLNNIASIELSGLILIVDDSSHGTIFLQFLTEYDVNQAYSLFNYLLENPGYQIPNPTPADTESPVIYFYENVLGTTYSVLFNGASYSSPNTALVATQSDFFSATISLTASGVSNGTVIDKSQLRYLLIESVDDNRDGVINVTDSNLSLSNYGATTSIDSITASGTYSLTFKLTDLAKNNLDNVTFNLNIT